MVNTALECDGILDNPPSKQEATNIIGFEALPAWGESEVFPRASSLHHTAVYSMYLRSLRLRSLKSSTPRTA